MNSSSFSAVSMITSFLGPCKSNKLVVDGNETHIVKCPYHLMKEAVCNDHFSYIIEETLHAHHQQFGCSSTSLLAMAYFWSAEFKLLLEEGYRVADIVEHSQSILTTVLSNLPQITINLKQYISGYQNSETKSRTATKHKYSFSKLPGISSPITSIKSHAVSTSCIPAGVRYSSRHYSPFQNNLENPKEDAIVEDGSLATTQLTEELKTYLRSLVDKLSHDDSKSAKLISDLWIQQVSSNNDFKFCIDCVTICSVTLPCAYSSVVDGLIIKTKFLPWYDQNMYLESKTLILKGSITFENVHLGYNTKFPVTLKRKADEIKVSQWETWFKNCCDLLLKLQINILLVHGSVDDNIATFCSSHSILLLPRVPWSSLEIICTAVKMPPSFYLLDCDNLNVILNIKVKQWKLKNNMSKDYQFFQIVFDPPIESINQYTVILCHPSSAFLNCQEHQLWHLASRLNLASASNKLLPGGSQTEKWCYNLIEGLPSENGSKAKFNLAVANGFAKYHEFVRHKIMMKENVNIDEAFDEMQSKVQAWRSAMSLAILALQCDLILINDCDNLAVEELNKHFLGFL